MKISVWDTYVTKKDGSLMHFDILVPDDFKNEKAIHAFGKSYLQSKNQENQLLTANECKFCHIENATEEIREAIEKKGFYIIEMEGCN